MRGRWIVIGVAVLAAAVFGAVWFQPQRLLYDDRVDEALPSMGAEAADTGAAGAASPAAAAADAGEDVAADDTDAPTETTAGEAAGAPAEPRLLASGEFGARSHPGAGTASIYELDGGRRVLRLEGFETDNGPDLFVYLTAAAPDAPEDEFEADYLDLGRLKGNVGDQNYDVPPDADLSRYRSVAIWCDRFSVVFTTAPLA